MGERAAAVFPFAIAVVLPPAGLILGLATVGEDRELGQRIMVVAALAIVIWALLLVSAT